MTIAYPRMNRVPADQRGVTLADFLVPIQLGERIGSPRPAHRPDRRSAPRSSRFAPS